MARWERSGYRDLAAMLWHRTIDDIRMIDLDFVQYCVRCNAPLVVGEICRREPLTEHIHKPTTILKTIAENLSNNDSPVKGLLMAYQRRTPDEADTAELRTELQRIAELEDQIKEMTQEVSSRMARLYQKHNGRMTPVITAFGVQQVYPTREPSNGLHICDLDKNDFAHWLHQYRLCSQCKENGKH